MNKDNAGTESGQGIPRSLEQAHPKQSFCQGAGLDMQTVQMSVFDTSFTRKRISQSIVVSAWLDFFQQFFFLNYSVQVFIFALWDRKPFPFQSFV